jgi:hypothetical protein
VLSRVCVERLQRVWVVVTRTNDCDMVRRTVLACHELQRDGCAFHSVNQPLDFEWPLSLPDAGGVLSWVRSGSGVWQCVCVREREGEREKERY